MPLTAEKTSNLKIYYIHHHKSKSINKSRTNRANHVYCSLNTDTGAGALGPHE